MLDPFPIMLVEDRYGGTYSGGAWLAISNAIDVLVEDSKAFLRLMAVLNDGPWGSDIEARNFWHAQPVWIASGDTPDAALFKLRERLKNV